jgi:glycerol-1-phosphate dehydrogenase [NAD(P)+]
MFMEFEAGHAGDRFGGLRDALRHGQVFKQRTGVPYVIVGTAPSMDGYASEGAPLICAGYKNSFVATLPYAIVGDYRHHEGSTAAF